MDLQQQQQQQQQQQPQYYSQYAMNAAAAMGVGTTIPQLPPPINNNNNATQHKADDDAQEQQQQQFQKANKQQTWNNNNEYLRELNEDVDDDAKKFATWINEAKKPPAADNNTNTNTNTNTNNKKPLPPLVLGLGNKMVAKKKKRRSSGPMPEKKVPGKWMTNYEELKQYKETHVNLRVPDNDPQYKQLNAWTRTQKQQYKLLHESKPNHMSTIRLNLLNELNFEWSGVARVHFWNDRYAELLLFYEINGNARVPEKYDIAPQLYCWVNGQRHQLKLRLEGNPSSKLTDERFEKLQAVGLETNIRNTSATWVERFDELREYKTKYGHCNVPQKWKENPSLGRWVDNQKTQHQKLYDGKKTNLTVERIQRLVGLGFNWRSGSSGGKETQSSGVGKKTGAT